MSDETASIMMKPGRVMSIDIFRGLNIALMIFVNELAGIGGLPWWTHHAAASVDVMTYVDMVFPGFLIIIGMSLPLAIKARERRGDRTAQLIWYIALRSIALIVLGLILENGSLGNAAAMHGLTPKIWTLLALLGAFLIWMEYPRKEAVPQRRTYSILRAIGVGLLIVLAILYRRTGDDGTTAWLTFAYPEILGSIGYSYLVAGICYITTRRWLWASLGWFAAFLTYNILSAAHILNAKHPWWFWPVQNGSKPALIFSGVVLTSIFLLEPRLKSFSTKARFAFALAVISSIAAWLLTPLGISKIRATPTWVLYDVAACSIIYCLLYYVCDVRRKTNWALPVRSSGSNTLLTYLLPDLWYLLLGIFGINWWSQHFNNGTAGVLRAAVFVIIMLAFSTMLTRFRLRLQL